MRRHLRNTPHIACGRCFHRRGFILIEVIAALTVLVIGAVGVFALLTMSIQSDSQTADSATARDIAQQQIEQIRCSNALPTPSTVDVSSQLPGGACSTTVTTQQAPGQTTLDLVTVTVTWTENNGIHTLTLETYMSAGGVTM